MSQTTVPPTSIQSKLDEALLRSEIQALQALVRQLLAAAPAPTGDFDIALADLSLKEIEARLWAARRRISCLRLATRFQKRAAAEDGKA